jgi:hypothetical protein
MQRHFISKLQKYFFQENEREKEKLERRRDIKREK